MKRVVIIGSGGSGKSTLARQLGAILGIEVVHLDALYWRPGWVQPEKAAWEDTVAELLARDAWVMDGNFGGTAEARLARADTIVLLDLPRALCLLRVLRRRVQYHGRSRPDTAGGCPEKVDWEFLTWIWNYPSRSRPAMLTRIGEAGEGKRVHILRSSGEVRRFLEVVRGQHVDVGDDRSAR